MRLITWNCNMAFRRKTDLIQGAEEHPTLYLYRHRNRPYHLDYCFVSTDMAKKLESVEVGDFDSWTKYRDHVPVIVVFRD